MLSRLVDLREKLPVMLAGVVIVPDCAFVELRENKACEKS